MKTAERIVGYLEGRLKAYSDRDPRLPEYYLIKELLRYIKEEDNDAGRLNP